jgi:hypothetical protein
LRDCPVAGQVLLSTADQVEAGDSLASIERNSV